MKVRALVDDDVAAAVRLHLQVLNMEFLSRFGPSFMSTYYRAWRETPGALSLVAVDDNDVLVGALLGASAPATHVRAMVRTHGVRLATRLALYALTHPRIARELIVTRGRRYARGLWRLLGARLRRRTASPRVQVEPVVGEITHVLVDPHVQGQGIGRALVTAAIDQARVSGVDELVLVTPPDMTARHFYERLGWQLEGDMRSRSGEEFLRFRYFLNEH